MRRYVSVAARDVTLLNRITKMTRLGVVALMAIIFAAGRFESVRVNNLLVRQGAVETRLKQVKILKGLLVLSSEIENEALEKKVSPF